MAKKDSARKDKASFADGAMSLFDRDNLEFLDALRYGLERISAATATAAPPKGDPTASADASDADHLFKRSRIGDDDERWDMGELDVKIIHRGRIRNRASAMAASHPDMQRRACRRRDPQGFLSQYLFTPE